MPRFRASSAARWVATLVTICVLALTALGKAHEATPGVVALKQVAPGSFMLRWSPPSPPVDDLTVRFPTPCQCAGKAELPTKTVPPGVPLVVECGASSLDGTLTFVSSAASLSRIAVNVTWLDGSQTLLLSSGDPATVQVHGSTQSGGSLEVFGQYLGLGVEHIWFGIDHLLFLLGLLLLVRGWRSTLYTVSAFTLAHSLTLVAAALELVSVPTEPVEICIALSVLLLALETTRGADSATRRWPWVVAFGFGLLHGLGFATALSEIGLPANAVAVALFGFNLGVELGQVAVVCVVALGQLLLKSRASLQTMVAHAATWVLGVCSVYWLLERVSAWLEGLGVLG